MGSEHRKHRKLMLGKLRVVKSFQRRVSQLKPKKLAGRTLKDSTGVKSRCDAGTINGIGSIELRIIGFPMERLDRSGQQLGRLRAITRLWGN